MGRKPLISFIIPCFNCEEYLKRCIYSITLQIDTGYEIVLINDGSKDHTAEICEQAAADNHNIRYISTPNNGAAGARNIGLDFASGEYIWFVDADDRIADGKLPEIIRILKRDSPSILSFNYSLESSEGISEVTRYKENGFETSANFLAFNHRLYLWNNVFKRSAIGSTRFFHGLINIEDFLFNVEVLINQDYIMCCTVVAYCYNTTNQNSTSRNHNKRHLVKLTEDSFTVHNRLHQVAQEHFGEKRQTVLRLLNLSAIGHIYSLLRFYNLRHVSRALKTYKDLGIFPFSLPKNKKASMLAITANTGLFGLLEKISRKL